MRFRPDSRVAHVAAWVEQQGRTLIPDFTEAACFLHALDPTTKEFSFRTFSDIAYTRLPGRDPLEQALHGTLDICWKALMELNRKGAAVGVTINRTNGRGRTKHDIRQVRALFLDHDKPSQRVDRFPITPHIQVNTSPGHYHYYWLVADLPLPNFTAWQRELAYRYQGDEKVLALNQTMQLPGFWRRKKLSRPLLSSIIKINRLSPYSKIELGRLLAE